MGGFLTIGYCFSIAFWKFLWGHGLDGGDKVVKGGSPSLPARENPGISSFTSI